jgi:hypothetical protein
VTVSGKEDDAVGEAEDEEAVVNTRAASTNCTIAEHGLWLAKRVWKRSPKGVEASPRFERRTCPCFGTAQRTPLEVTGNNCDEKQPLS